MILNANRFPDDFVSQLTDEKVDWLVSQNALSSRQTPGEPLPILFDHLFLRSILIRVMRSRIPPLFRKSSLSDFNCLKSK
jgi:hypothetical protein